MENTMNEKKVGAQETAEQTAQNNDSTVETDNKNPQQSDTQKKKKKRNVEACKIDHTNDSITITKDFAKKANDPSSAEFKHLANLRKSFPNYKVVARAAASPEARPSMKGLTEVFMERYINLLHKNDLAEYKRQKEISEAFKCPHMYMRKWFNKKYPDWREYKVQEAA